MGPARKSRERKKTLKFSRMNLRVSPKTRPKFLTRSNLNGACVALIAIRFRRVFTCDDKVFFFGFDQPFECACMCDSCKHKADDKEADCYGIIFIPCNCMAYQSNNGKNSENNSQQKQESRFRVHVEIIIPEAFFRVGT